MKRMAKRLDGDNFGLHYTSWLRTFRRLSLKVGRGIGTRGSGDMGRGDVPRPTPHVPRPTSHVPVPVTAHSEAEVENAHRTGKKQGEKPRHIIANLDSRAF